MAETNDENRHGKCMNARFSPARNGRPASLRRADTALKSPIRDFQAGLRIGAASNAMAGRPEEAHQTVVRLQRLNPALRVSNLTDVLGPYRRAEDLARDTRRDCGKPGCPNDIPTSMPREATSEKWDFNVDDPN
jgi:hypothetical protein